MICIYDIFWNVNQRNGSERRNCTKNRIYLVKFFFSPKLYGKSLNSQNQFVYHVEIHKHIWNDRVHLAASVSRLRIKNGALSLLEMLPTHLQDDKVAIATANPIVTGWVNPFKLTYIFFIWFLPHDRIQIRPIILFTEPKVKRSNRFVQTDFGNLTKRRTVKLG